MDKDFNKDFERKLTSALDGAAPEEAEALLRGIGESTAEGPDELAERRIRNAVLAKCGAADAAAAENKPAARKKAGRIGWKKLVAAACAVLLLAGIGFGARAYAKEAKEYKTAVGFFEDNALPTEGLTRKEIKTVYNDITSNNFKEPETAKVLTAYAGNLSEEMVNTGTNARAGADYLWALNSSVGAEPYSVDIMCGASLLYDGNVHFGRELITLNYEGHATGFLEKYVLSKYVGSEKVWSVDFPLERVEICKVVSGGVLVAGATEIIDEWHTSVLGNGDLSEEELEQLRRQFIREELPKYADHAEQRRFIAKIGENGEIVFKAYFERLKSEADYEGSYYYDYIEYGSVLLETPEGYALLENGRHNYRAFILTRFSDNGELLSYESPALGEYGDLWMRYAAPSGDGAIALLSADQAVHKSYTYDPVIYNVIRIGPDGSVTGLGTFTAPYTHFCISGIAERDGKLLVSGYRWDNDGEYPDGYVGSHGEIIGVVSELFADMDRWTGDDGIVVPSDYLTPRVRALYEAKLLQREPDGTVSELCSVPGAIGSILSAGADGSLIWNVDSIISTFYSPATNSFTVGGACRVDRYRFASAGAGPSVEQTGAVTIFRR